MSAPPVDSASEGAAEIPPPVIPQTLSNNIASVDQRESMPQDSVEDPEDWQTNKQTAATSSIVVPLLRATQDFDQSSHSDTQLSFRRDDIIEHLGKLGGGSFSYGQLRRLGPNGEVLRGIYPTQFAEPLVKSEGSHQNEEQTYTQLGDQRDPTNTFTGTTGTDTPSASPTEFYPQALAFLGPPNAPLSPPMPRSPSIQLELASDYASSGPDSPPMARSDSPLIQYISGVAVGLVGLHDPIGGGSSGEKAPQTFVQGVSPPLSPPGGNEYSTNTYYNQYPIGSPPNTLPNPGLGTQMYHGVPTLSGNGYTFGVGNHPPPQRADTQGTMSQNLSPPVPTMNQALSPNYHQGQEDRKPTPPPPDTDPDALNAHLSPQQRAYNAQRALFDACKHELFHTTTRTLDATQPKTSIINITALQHGALHTLQRDLTSYTSAMFQTGAFIPQLQDFYSLHDLLDKYSTSAHSLPSLSPPILPTQLATANPTPFLPNSQSRPKPRFHERSRQTRLHNDPFLIKSSRALERDSMSCAGLIPTHVLPSGPLPSATDAACPQLSNMGRNEANRAAYEKNRIQRFAMAMAGGLLLVVPVLIMANVPGKVASLVTTCVSMLVFAVLITAATELGPNEVLATTAGYAAVLVVFVGTSMASSSS